ncbi:hypothetical protein [Dictyobacter arantiisoli]|uniref:Uncharacterized protein n=1 Tax=Dictyobacter arantiisoli TaxID=2014874 RepID=A0A5A5T5E8_9CHLR|nr:hypothetical protein [Dictyobacter arantiisoli]GCF06537.1 hypothetical protein KDI_01010 [Dictyobacter arantiisoli]
MSKDHLERRTYRKSPGRQYGYDYNPLRTPNDSSVRSNPTNAASRSGMMLAQRPDPRRTRQLMRQSIIASKRPGEDGIEQLEFSDQPNPEAGLVGSRSGRRSGARHSGAEEYGSNVRFVHHPIRQSRSGRADVPPLPFTSSLLVPSDDEYDEHDNDDEYGDIYRNEDWRDLAEVDPDLGIEESLNQRVRYTRTFDDDYDDEPSLRPARASSLRQPVPAKLTQRLSPALPERIYPDEDPNYEYEYEYEEDRSSVGQSKRGAKKKKLSRRGLLIGAGAAAVAGVGFAAIEYGPKVPQAVGTVGSNVEQQVQDAFNKGVSQGVDQARKEFVSSLDTLEGFTLEGAISAARLTREAYDVFVSPIVKFGATITGDVLQGMLKAFKTAREWLAGVYQDNATLIAIQKVLESWVNQVNLMPKQLDAITQSDLDGAQAYLRALQRKVADEKAKINATRTPTAASPTAVLPPPAKKK